AVGMGASFAGVSISRRCETRDPTKRLKLVSEMPEIKQYARHSVQTVKAAAKMGAVGLTDKERP
ncbi:hypothetical protein CKO38_18330, partial [Rhodospirillum rubrum]|nr:hypothetical protein [Rhodospirillum rubrum]